MKKKKLNRSVKSSGVKKVAKRVAYLPLRVEEGTKKQAEEFPSDEGIIPNPFIMRSLQQHEYSVFPSKAKGRGAASDSPGHSNADASLSSSTG
jgi:hypothetical protein